jgi:hypothetical protein
VEQLTRSGYCKRGDRQSKAGDRGAVGLYKVKVDGAAQQAKGDAQKRWATLRMRRRPSKTGPKRSRSPQEALKSDKKKLRHALRGHGSSCDGRDGGGARFPEYATKLVQLTAIASLA